MKPSSVDEKPQDINPWGSLLSPATLHTAIPEQWPPDDRYAGKSTLW
jgi:hypothetical protein